MDAGNSLLKRIQPTFWLSLILLLGVSLRIYQLGHDSFWNDEVGVALAAQAGTFSEMLQAAHNHVMAMPLDYVVVWAFARLNASEAFLRLPAALWGSLSIVIAYGFFSRLSNTRVGLTAALLLALSPLHIQYSQELRFYASLTFFYLAASWLLLIAIEESSTRAWVGFTFIAIVGIFFHVYVLLVLANGVIWLALHPGKGSQKSNRRMAFIRSSLLILCAFLFGVLFFGGVYSYDIPLVLEDSSLFSVIGIALGWIPFYPPTSNIVSAWGWVCLILEVIGIGYILIRKPRHPSSALFFSLVIQLLVVIAMNAAKHYFIAPRQLIFFLPVMLYFAAQGLSWITGKISRAGVRNSRAQQRDRANLVGNSLVFILILGLCMPAVLDYYRGDKGEAREISRFINERMQTDDVALVIPDFEVQMIRYYYNEINPKKEPLIYGAGWDDLQTVCEQSGSCYLVTEAALSPEKTELLSSLGFQPVFHNGITSRYARTVWVGY